MRNGLYFGAGPAALPTSVVEKAAAEFIEYEDQGVGLGEMSHRSKKADSILTLAKNQIRELLKVPNTHEVLFLQGGGTGGFASCVYAMAAYVLNTRSVTAEHPIRGDYIVSGSWSAKAIKESDRLGVPDLKYIMQEQPKQSYGDFLYYCDNETVDGVEFPGKTTTPPISGYKSVVCDISSNMFSREIDVSKFAILFGGAQKNLGIPGVSLYVVRRDILEAQKAVSPQDLRAAGLPVAPSFLDMSLAAANNSAYNTVSIFAVEVIKLVTAKLIEHGGIVPQEKEANAKAAELYAALDARPNVYKLPAPKDLRSRMNIVFQLTGGDAASDKFLKEAAARGISGIKGHRSVGGMRVSNYNAVTPEAISKVTQLVKEFQP